MWSAPNSRGRSWRLDRAGNSTLQFALVAILLFMMMFGVFDLCRYFLAWHGLNTIASEAARAWMINSGTTYTCHNPTSGTAATVAAAAPFLNPSQLTLCVIVNQNKLPNGDVASTQVNVTASYPFSFMIAPLSAANGTLSATTQLTY